MRASLWLSDDKTRLATDEPVFGIACYYGEVQDGQFNGMLAFNSGDVAAVQRWLDGAPSPSRGSYPGRKGVGRRERE